MSTADANHICISRQKLKKTPEYTENTEYHTVQKRNIKTELHKYPSHDETLTLKKPFYET